MLDLGEFVEWVAWGGWIGELNSAINCLFCSVGKDFKCKLARNKTKN